MLKIMSRFAIVLACFLVIALMIQHILVLRLGDDPGLEGHIEQLGAALLAGTALGIAIPIAARRWFIAASLVVGGLLFMVHSVVLAADAHGLHILMSWLGASLGLLIMRGLYRSWTAMYEKHLVPWGGAPHRGWHDTEDDEDYHVPHPRQLRR
jgi:hypothetical protein